MFSADDISMIVIAFEPPRHVHLKPSDKNKAELDRHERICLAVGKGGQKKEETG